MNAQALTVIIIMLISGSLAATMTVYALRRRHLPGMTPFALMTAGLAWWAAWYAAEIILPGLSAKLWMARLEYVGIVWVPLGWVLFALSYTGRDKWLTSNRVLLLTVIPIATIIFAFTSDLHPWFYTSISLNNNGPLSVLDASYGPAWYSYFIYAYLLMLLGTAALLFGIFAFPRAYWFQQALLVLSPLVPWISNALYILRISPVPQLDLSPIAFTVSAMILSADIFRFGLFDITPVARAAVVDQMSIAMLVLDGQDRLVDINPSACQLLKCKPEEVLTQPIKTVLINWPELAAQALQKQEASEEITFQGETMTSYYRMQINLILTRNRTVTGRMVMLTDITKDKLAEKALAMAQVRTEFLAKVSHELRTPLNGIMGIVEMLQYGVYGEITSRQQESLSKIIERVKYLNQLVNDLLQHTKLEAGKFNLEVKEFKPELLLQSVREAFEASADRKGLKIHTELAGDVPAVLTGDMVRLFQITSNLVDNAIKFTNEGEVRVSIIRSGPQHWAVQVSDTGLGIPEEQHQHIFDAFQQANFSITRNFSGVGLGLAIVKQLTEAMGGTVSLRSNTAKGSVFLVTFPIQAVPATAEIK